ncbi:MAG: T9SS type A sorting domain-containing protein [Ignavibacteria bacterium]|nr:T9SS type A sorting domain-containing protein [Ignavibacteria bacterium]
MFTTAISKQEGIIPEKFNLHQNYPNPFNPATNIKFDIPKASYVKLTIYNILGKEITTLVNEKLNIGSYEVNWNGMDYPSGVYFYKMVADDYVNVKKMVLLK